MAQLSSRARAVWAKSHLDPARPGVLDGWLPLHQHLADAAAIAGHLWDEWAAPSVKDTLARAIGSPESARALVMWLSGVHDVGKCSPAFAMMVPALTQQMREHGLIIDHHVIVDDRRHLTRHEVVGYLAVVDHLRDVHGFDAALARSLASVVAAHHGNPPSPAQINTASGLPHLFGEGLWAATRTELLNHGDALWTTTESVQHWRSARLTAPVLVLLSALVIVADWLASSSAFDIAPLGEDPRGSTAERAANAWRLLGFPHPWTAAPESTDAATLLKSRFALPPGATPRPAQIELVSQALTVEQPELLILEAEMGSGKTEAALLAAEILAARFRLSGVFVGLPTRATADGMFGRILSWTRHLGIETPASINLAHGAARLNQHFERLTTFGAIGEQPTFARPGASEESVIAHRWFASPRRGPLSDFVVGTVDQALFAGLRSRYLMLRHLAFASKVVIIDEAHAYDEYMSAYLTRFLEWLGAYGVPVIMLSATLPRARRVEFHAAYALGRKRMSARERLSAAETSERRRDDAALEKAQADAVTIGAEYPLITVSSGRGLPRLVNVPPSGRRQHLAIEWLPDSDDALIRVLEDALPDGGCVAIIRNTVRRAQETADYLRRHTSIPVTLAHSRFLGIDRARKDAALLDLFGRDGLRPELHIVVATQVIEQSLDLDFDLMISDLAPIDLLLQRSGRMHRHDRDTRPDALATPRLILTGVDAAETPPRIDRGTRYVYDHALLLRTLAAIRAQSTVSVPDDIAPLVDRVYDSDDITLMPEGWLDTYHTAEMAHQRARDAKVQKASQHALQHVSQETTSLLGWLDGPDVDPELAPPGTGTVRDSNGDTLEVIVLQRRDGVLCIPEWVDGRGEQIPDNEPPSREQTRTILGCALRLPMGMCAGDRLDRHIAALERMFELPAWHTSHELRGQLVLIVDEKGCAQLNEYDLTYSPDDGLRYSLRTNE